MLSTFPDELLLAVAAPLPLSALRALAAASRRLHYIFHPVVLASHGIEDPWYTLNLRSNAVLFSAAAALYTRDITNLHAHLAARDARAGSVAQIDAISRIIARADHVDHVELDLWRLERWAATSGAISDGPASGGLKGPADSWMHTLSAVLKTLVNDKQCTTLTVRRGVCTSQHAPGAGARFPSVPLRARITRATELAPATHLHTFHAHSPLLFHPMFFQWTLATINASPLKKLSFAGVALVPSAWTALLNAISLPQLTSFNLDAAGVPFPALASFLARHPTLTTLTLAASVSPGFRARLPPHALPALTTLAAAPPLAAALVHRPEAGRSLSSVTLTAYIPAPISTKPAPAVARLEIALAALVARIPRPTLNVALHGPGAKSWLAGPPPASLTHAPKTLSASTPISMRA